MRKAVERTCDQSRSLKEPIASAQVTLRESRALVALSRGRPYLATEMGERTIRGAGGPARLTGEIKGRKGNLRRRVLLQVPEGLPRGRGRARQGQILSER
jgi:hypothetical protein